MYQLNYRSFIILFFLLLAIICDTIDLSEYKYPEKDSSDKLIRIAILGTNDFHGGIFPNYFTDSNNKRYQNGGGLNLYSYVKTLRQDWADQFLWLDGGDQFHGSMECMLSDYTILRDYYNKTGLQGIGLGEHDFDYGLDYLKEYIENQSFPVLAANVKFSNGIYLWEQWENILPYKIYTFETNPKIKIGVIGLASKKSPSLTSGNISNLIFEDYLTTTKNWVEFLRNEIKVNAVILLTHFGPICKNDPEKMILKMRDSSTEQKRCEETEEIMDFLKQIKKEEIQIDGIISAQSHDNVHHWISDIPVIQSSGSDYFNILYLPFRLVKEEMKLQINKIQIEGPIPICEKLWPISKNCEYKYENSSIMQEFIFHKSQIKLDEELSNSLKYWNDIIIEKVENQLCEIKDEMFLDGIKETFLTNFVTDLGKIITESDICFFNLDGLESSWHKGPINEIDLFKMFPYNYTWVRFEMTGEEVYNMFKELSYYNFYPYSGAIQTFKYKNSIYTMNNLMLWDGLEEKLLEPNKLYKICTNEFLAKGGSDMRNVRKWYKELRNKKDFGLIRELILKYLKKIKNPISKEKFVNERNPRIIILDN